MSTATVDGSVHEQNRITLWKLLAIIPVMLIFCALMVPLYKQVCAALGLTATQAVAQNTQIDYSRKVAVDFVANLNQNFAWNFQPLDKHVEIHPGEMVTIHYRVTNSLPYASTGRAVPSFGPMLKIASAVVIRFFGNASPIIE